MSTPTIPGYTGDLTALASLADSLRRSFEHNGLFEERLYEDTVELQLGSLRRWFTLAGLQQMLDEVQEASDRISHELTGIHDVINTAAYLTVKGHALSSGSHVEHSPSESVPVGRPGLSCVSHVDQVSTTPVPVGRPGLSCVSRVDSPPPEGVPVGRPSALLTCFALEYGLPSEEDGPFVVVRAEEAKDPVLYRVERMLCPSGREPRTRLSHRWDIARRYRDPLYARRSAADLAKERGEPASWFWLVSYAQATAWNLADITEKGGVK